MFIRHLMHNGVILYCFSDYVSFLALSRLNLWQIWLGHTCI